MLKNLERVMKAASDGTRLRILNLLGPGPLCVCEIVEAVGLSQSTVSRHLAILRDAGLIQDEKRGKWAYYMLPSGARDDLAGGVLTLVLDEAGRDAAARKDLRTLRRIHCGPAPGTCPPAASPRKGGRP